MAIPESQLDTWSHQGSIAQSSDTYAAVKGALEAAGAGYAHKSFEVFLQGSYGNNTNIYAESDVDMVICIDSVYYYDISALTAEEQAYFKAALTPGDYPYADYKADVVAALVKGFGVADVQVGNKAVKIKASGSRRRADVVTAAEFRRYHSSAAGPQYERGICFFTPTDERIINYPKQHSTNCTAKHQGTGQWFKPMVRIVKNMRGRLVDNGTIKAGVAPSYFLEGLLYNVPNDKFGNSYGATFGAALSWIRAARRDTFVCPNGQYYLVRDSVPMCWPVADCDLFIEKVVELWNNWQ